MGLAVMMEDEWPPKGRTLGSCPFLVDCKMSTGRGGWFAPKQGCAFLASDSGKDIIMGTGHPLSSTE